MSEREVDELLFSLVKDDDAEGRPPGFSLEAEDSPPGFSLHEDSPPGSPLSRASSETERLSNTTDTESCVDSADGHALAELLEEPQRRTVVTVAVAPGVSVRASAPKRARPATSSHLDEYPPAFDEESRKERKMARNRRAAANSRARKKEQLDVLTAQVEELQEENLTLRRRLIDAGLMHPSGGDADAARPDQRPISLTRHPAVLSTLLSPQLESYQPLVLAAATLACYLCLLALLAHSRAGFAPSPAPSRPKPAGPCATAAARADASGRPSPLRLSALAPPDVSLGARGARIRPDERCSRSSSRRCGPLAAAALAVCVGGAM